MARNATVGTLLISFASFAHAEYGLGYNAGDFDPQTHEYHRIYKDWQEGVQLDSAGNYTVTYKGGDGVYSQTTFEPATKIAPFLASTWKSIGRDLVTYSYHLRSGAQSQQNIESLLLIVSNVNGGPDSPHEWKGFIAPTFTDSALRLSWTYMGKADLGGLRPGRELRGLRILSRDLPGITRAQVKGASRATTWLGSMPQGDVGKRVNQLIDADYVSRYAVAPTIVVPIPFTVPPVLAALQKHVDRDLLGMNLIDAALVARLDPLFQAAIAASQGGNIVALRADLRELRSALNNGRRQEERPESTESEREIEDAGDKAEISRNRPIAPIAKAVLEFDIRYLERHSVQADKNQERGER